MRTVSLGYEDVHQLAQVRKNMFWDGWTLVIVDKRGDGWMRKDGIFFDDTWAIQKRFDVLPTGQWRVPAKYV